MRTTLALNELSSRNNSITDRQIQTKYKQIFEM